MLSLNSRIEFELWLDVQTIENDFTEWFFDLIAKLFAYIDYRTRFLRSALTAFPVRSRFEVRISVVRAFNAVTWYNVIRRPSPLRCSTGERTVVWHRCPGASLAMT
jgi:hypothetical protein